MEARNKPSEPAMVRKKKDCTPQSSKNPSALPGAQPWMSASRFLRPSLDGVYGTTIRVSGHPITRVGSLTGDVSSSPVILVPHLASSYEPYHRPNPFYEKLKMEHQQVMSDLQNFKNENWEASQKLSELTKEKVFLCDLQSRLLMEQSQLKKKLDMLRQEKENLLEDWMLLKHHSDDLQVLSKGQ
ncbi:disks large homolog 5-like [Peromyscus maniculatus bairdii]|uniref:disks large homolog 5-like n=1 Tax=Peromyscus maniculatus bairdii TaxID=230844 RepID=UPI003FD61E01